MNRNEAPDIDIGALRKWYTHKWYTHMQIPAGYRRQGSAERMTDGEWFTRWPVMDLPSD